MSTLGFGDITFDSDLGRGFTIVVLVWGIVMLLVVLPFTFIRFFYAPWLEAQVRLRAPRSVPDDARDHVIICSHDEVAVSLIRRLDELAIPYFVIEPDPAVAAEMHADGISVVAGSPDRVETYRSMRIEYARLVLANKSDPINTNITLTVRELAPDVPIVALVSNEDSVDLLELSGASHVLPLKHQLGQHLASRVTVGARRAHRIGHFEDLVIAEFPINGTSMPGKTVRETKLRNLTGLCIIGVWESGQLQPAGPNTVLAEHSVPVIIGTEEELQELDSFFSIYLPNENPVLVIGGGKVGYAAAQALQERGARVTVLDIESTLESDLSEVADNVVIGDASNRQALMRAGLSTAPSVLLTTNDDATNIFLTVYCRKLNPDVHIVSRLTHEWNIEAVARAGADFTLSHIAVATKTIVSLIEERELMIIGQGTELFIEPVPRELAGKKLLDSRIGADTGLNVIAIREDGVSTTSPPAETVLPEGASLVMLGTSEQHQEYLTKFGSR